MLDPTEHPYVQPPTDEIGKDISSCKSHDTNHQADNSHWKTHTKLQARHLKNMVIILALFILARTRSLI